MRTSTRITISSWDKCLNVHARAFVKCSDSSRLEMLIVSGRYKFEWLFLLFYLLLLFALRLCWNREYSYRRHIDVHRRDMAVCQFVYINAWPQIDQKTYTHKLSPEKNSKTSAYTALKMAFDCLPVPVLQTALKHSVHFPLIGAI